LQGFRHFFCDSSGEKRGLQQLIDNPEKELEIKVDFSAWSQHFRDKKCVLSNIRFMCR
jgi:hypothetical protein